MGMPLSSQPFAGIGIGDGRGEQAATDRDQNDVEHGNPPPKRRLEAERTQRQGDRCGSREMERQYKPDFAQHLGGRRHVTGERLMVHTLLRTPDEAKSRFHRRPTWRQAP
jgi:hypothetical protein